VVASAGAGRFWLGPGTGKPGIDGIWRHSAAVDERELELGIAEQHLVPPDGCSDLILRFSRGRLVGVLVQEPTLAAEVVQIAPEDALFGVRFDMGTGGALLKHRTSIVLEAQRLFEREEPEDAERLLERLLGLSGQLVERYAQGQPEWFREALSLAQARYGDVTIEQLARHAGLSERTLQRWFVNWVGAGPKQLLRVLRIREAVRRARGASSLAEVAAELGFADQAHLSREMSSLWGTSPGRLRGLSDSFKTSLSAKV
jgi:AraC-like DNA-binding protein